MTHLLTDLPITPTMQTLATQIRFLFLKTISAIVIGGSNQYLTIKWGFDYTGSYQAQNIYIPTQISYEYGIGEYGIAEYTSGVPIKTLRANASGAGKIVQTGYETTINDVSLSLQKIEIQAKDGKTA